MDELTGIGSKDYRQETPGWLFFQGTSRNPEELPWEYPRNMERTEKKQVRVKF